MSKNLPRKLEHDDKVEYIGEATEHHRARRDLLRPLAALRRVGESRSVPTRQRPAAPVRHHPQSAFNLG